MPRVADIALLLQQPVFEVRFLNWPLALFGGLACIAVVVLFVVAIFAATIGNRRKKQE